MGSSNSRLSSSARSGGDRPNFRIASLFCGTFFPDDLPIQIEDQSNHVAGLHVDNDPRNLIRDPSCIPSTEGHHSALSIENATSSQGHSVVDKSVNDADSPRGETSNYFKNLSKSKELPPCETNAYSCIGGTQDQSSIKSSSLESSSNTNGIISLPTMLADASSNVHDPQVSSETFCSSGVPQQAFRNSYPIDTSSSDYEPFSDESAQETGSRGSGFQWPILHEEGRNLVQVDVISVSSDLATSSTEDVNNREVRRNSRRLFWDAFSRQNSRLNDSLPSVILSSVSDNDLRSHNRWILDFSDDGVTFGNGVGDESAPWNIRRRTAHEQRRSRSEFWEGLHGSISERNGNFNLCASGLHPEGSCSCESLLMAEVSSARASISRIVLLAEALFEVLDEIHSQPESLSFSMVSHPAPESIVNSFPTKPYKVTNMPANSENAEQCYICLAEYEEGDDIRTLPCQHEYHVSCVDKWLKDIHGVCPLCRRDVSQGLAEFPAPSS